MNFIRHHWYDMGGILAVLLMPFLIVFQSALTDYQLLMWLSLISLFFHQLEEYRIVGTFPGMINKVMYKSETPDRFPLNTHTAFVVNVYFGWTVYFLAALAGEKAVWLGVATLMVSLGNLVAHTLIFNLKGKTFYNAGMATSWLFFVPCIFFFIKIVDTEHLMTATDMLIGIPLGLAFNFFGILKPIAWMANKNTGYIFDNRNLLPADRNPIH